MKNRLITYLGRTYGEYKDVCDQFCLLKWRLSSWGYLSVIIVEYTMEMEQNGDDNHLAEPCLMLTILWTRSASAERFCPTSVVVAFKTQCLFPRELNYWRPWRRYVSLKPSLIFSGSQFRRLNSLPRPTWSQSHSQVISRVVLLTSTTIMSIRV